MKEKNKEKVENPMKEIKIEKVVLSVGGTGEYLERGVKLLKLLTKRKPCKTRSKRRIPSLNVKPGLEVGVFVTLRENFEELLEKLLNSLDNTLSKKQISKNGFSFGIKEYIEIPGVEYQRDIGIMGFDITVVFKRAGKRIALRKIRKRKMPERQMVSKEEIIKFMEEKFKTNFK